MLRYKTKTRPG